MFTDGKCSQTENVYNPSSPDQSLGDFAETPSAGQYPRWIVTSVRFFVPFSERFSLSFIRLKRSLPLAAGSGNVASIINFSKFANEFDLLAARSKLTELTWTAVLSDNLLGNECSPLGWDRDGRTVMHVASASGASSASEFARDLLNGADCR